MHCFVLLGWNSDYQKIFHLPSFSVFIGCSQLSSSKQLVFRLWPCVYVMTSWLNVWACIQSYISFHTNEQSGILRSWQMCLVLVKPSPMSPAACGSHQAFSFFPILSLDLNTGPVRTSQAFYHWAVPSAPVINSLWWAQVEIGISREFHRCSTLFKIVLIWHPLITEFQPVEHCWINSIVDVSTFLGRSVLLLIQLLLSVRFYFSLINIAVIYLFLNWSFGLRIEFLLYFYI